MIKTLRNIFRQDRDKYVIPKSVQEIIPAKAVYEDGIFLVGRNKYSMTYMFTDINYAVAGSEDKESMFLEYSEFLNSFDSGATTKITIINRRLSAAGILDSILIKEKQDKRDKYIKEYNKMLTDKIKGTESLVRELYVTVSVQKKNIGEARTYFRRITTDISTHLSRLDSKSVCLNLTQRLKLLHDFYRQGEEEHFRFDLSETMRKGHSFKDYICPDVYENESDHFKIGERYGRVLFLKEYASYIKDTMVSDLTDSCKDLIMSIDVIPVPTDEAVRELERRLLGIETNITNWQRRQNNNNNFSAVIPYEMEQQRKEGKEFLDDVTTRDQRMMFAVVTIVHTADSLESLNDDTESIKTTARKHLCQISTLKYQQLDGLNTALPVGTRKIDALRTLTTESLAVLIPYRVQEIMDGNGIFLGENAVSGNLILANKDYLMNPNSFLLGVPGSGKSFSAKEQITFLALATDDDILVCDPEREYAAQIEAFGGEVIRIAAGSEDHINALDMVEGYGESANPVIDKSEFILSLFEQLDKDGIGPHEKSIIDRCTDAVYKDYMNGGEVPTLHVFRKKLLEQKEDEAKELALSLELFTDGSLDAFAHETNVDTNNRMVVYDIMDLGRQLKTMGLLVVTDAMLNRVTENWKKGTRTHVFLDEFHVVFENEHSASFFNNAYRRFRKRNAFLTSITQNVEYILDSVMASTMLSNSECIVMLNQAASDREKLAKLLNISEEQMSYITNANAGCGLLRYGSAIVPFTNSFPKDTELYRLMTTKATEEGAWQEISDKRAS